MNMFLHGVYSADIRKGDTLGTPQHTQGGELMTFDRVIANPPFSLNKWGKEEADADPYGRFPYGTPPKDSGDLAFVQHMIASLNAEGMAGVVMPHGVLFRGSSEKAIRQGILNDDLLEAVIGLPAGLFYGTGIPACLLIINKNKPAERKGKVLFINGELDYQEGKNQNSLRPQDIEKIVQTFEGFAEVRRYSKVFTLAEIAENDYNLNIRRYADTSPPPEMFDVRAILHGGIPVREVESEYIREEILQDFDVNTVFIPRHGEERSDVAIHYYDFKPEIDSKEKIRDIVTRHHQAQNTSGRHCEERSDAAIHDYDLSAVIEQLERWWDKYRVSLKELDAEVAEAEQVMKSYLQELGYE